MTTVEAIQALTNAIRESNDGQYGELITISSTLHSIEGSFREAVDLLEEIRDSLVQKP